MKKFQKVTKPIMKKMGQCTHMNSNHVHICVKHIPNRVHDPFSKFFGLHAPLQKRLGGVAYEYMLILAENFKNGQNKASKYYNGVRNKFEIMHIRVGHIGNRVYAPSSNLFRLGFPTQNNLG